jgi:hypothetical protein
VCHDCVASSAHDGHRVVGSAQAKGFIRTKLARFSEQLGKELDNLVPTEFDFEVQRAVEKEHDKLKCIHQVRKTLPVRNTL